MKSDFVGIGEADFISSEASRRFHPSLLGFHRATHDFICDIQGLRLDLFAIVWYNKLIENSEYDDDIMKKGGDLIG